MSFVMLSKLRKHPKNQNAYDQSIAKICNIHTFDLPSRSIDCAGAALREAREEA